VVALLRVWRWSGRGRGGSERGGHAGERVAVAESGGGVVLDLASVCRASNLSRQGSFLFHRGILAFLGVCSW
jgi:hypothetical protein